jgi:hypothetical protein
MQAPTGGTGVLSNARVGVAGGPRAAEGDARARGVRLIDWLADRATPCLPVSCQATTRPVPEWASAAAAAWCVEGQGSIALLLLRAVHGGGSGESPPDVCGPAEGRGVSPVLMRCRRRRGQSLSSGRVVCGPLACERPGAGCKSSRTCEVESRSRPRPRPGGRGYPRAGSSSV